MLPGLLPGADRDMVSILARRVAKFADKVMLKSRVVGMEEEKSGIRVRFEGEGIEDSTGVFEKVLVSVGRRPNSKIPGLENTQVKVDERGFIQVDSQRKTADPSIYAIGDVVGEPMLAHKASHEGRIAVEAIAGHKVAFEPKAIPAVVFTDPELAWCGLTETEAREQKRSVKVSLGCFGASHHPGSFRWHHQAISRSGDRTDPGGGYRGSRSGRADLRSGFGDRDGGERFRHQVDDPSSSHTFGNGDGGGGGLLRPGDSRVPSGKTLAGHEPVCCCC
jgi:hypothetical protein